MKRYSIAIAGIIIFCSVLFPSYSFTADDSLKIEEEANARYDGSVGRKLPSGWINSISSSSVIIDDTHYILNRQTMYPDGRSKLKEGAFVKFEIEIDNILSQISLADPQEDDMYMKPIIRTNKQVQEESSGNDGNSGSNSQEGMHLENGVWVN